MLFIITLSSVVVSFVSGEHFFKSAREAQIYSLSRVIQVAANEIMTELHAQVYDVASALSSKGTIPE